MDLELNEQQRDAVEHGEGPLLIIAGAGTGKTRVISHRVARLIETGRAKPKEILALTFTDKAALEMEERVDLLMPLGSFGYTISTFHAFGDRVLRDYGLVLGLTSDFKVLSRAEQIIFFQEHLFEFDLNYYRPLGNPTKHIDALLTLFSRAKDEDVTPEEYLAYAERLQRAISEGPGTPELEEEAVEAMELAQAYQRYQSLLLKAGLLDFGDLVALPLKLFRTHPQILRKYQDRYKYVLVDEFQDTNFIQFQLLRLLAQRHENITVVGDDDQSIYKFRGAALSNLLNFSFHFQNARRVVLTENYRSAQPILDASYRLIQRNNPDRLEVQHNIRKKLTARTQGGRAVTFTRYDTLTSESDGVAQLIDEKVKTGKYGFRDFAVLFRTNQAAIPYLQSLNLKGIPFQFSGNRGLYQREEIRLLLAFLRVIADPSDSPSLFHLVQSPLYGIGARDIVPLMAFARRYRRSLYEVIQGVLSDSPPRGFTLEEQMNLAKAGESLSLEGRATAQKCLEDIWDYAEKAQTLTTGVLLYTFLTESGFLERLGREGTPESDRCIQNIAKFFEAVKHFEYVAPEDRLHRVIRHLDLLIDSGDDPAEADLATQEEAVRLLTVHKSKGLEFRVVFLVGLSDHHFPTRRRKDPIELPEALIKDLLPSGDFHDQEERRLFYVGMTRAREELYLSCAHDRGGKRTYRVSPFVLEALGISEATAPLRQPSPLQRIERFSPSPAVAPDFPFPVREEETLHLSYYQMDDYLTCPLKYKYVHILKVPVYRHHSIIYGNALHRAIQDYLRSKADGSPISFRELQASFEGAWSSEGFQDRAHEKLRFQSGLDALSRFYEREEKEGILPAFVEREFSFFLGNNRIGGRWDRIDVQADRVTITDYKSSNVHTQEKADKEIKKNLQLSLYAFAYWSIEGKIPDRVELHFLESGLTGSLAKTEKDLGKTAETIQSVAAGIRSGNFEPKPTFIACRYCPFREICPYTATRY